MINSISVKTRFGWISAFEEKNQIVRIKFGKHDKISNTKNLKNLKNLKKNLKILKNLKKNLKNLKIAVKIFKNFKILRNSNLDNLIFLAIVISIILEVFPFKSTGSIFSTSNMTYLALIASILLSYRRKLDI